MTVIYLNNNATTQVDQAVLEAMLPFYHELYGNPSSMHSFGGQVGRQVREAREQVADLLGAQPDEIIFTSCGTESDNTAIRSALATFPDKRHLVTTRVEHPAINALVARLCLEYERALPSGERLASVLLAIWCRRNNPPRGTYYLNVIWASGISPLVAREGLKLIRFPMRAYATM